MRIIVWTQIKIQIQNIMFYCWKSSGSRMSFAFLGLLEVVTSWNLVDMAAARNSGDNQMVRSLQGGRLTDHDVTQMITAARRSLMTSQEWLDRIEDRVLSSRGWTPRDCADIQESGRNESGRYAIYPDDCDDPFFVYCDMETDRGGWTVFQRRLDGGVEFDRDWAAYKHGFGSVTGEHWLGNERIHRIASQKLYQLRIDMEDFEGETRFAEYRTFRLSDENTNYVLRVGHYTGDAGNGLTSHNNRPFTTKDRDNDAYEGNCAATFFGGWWYYACHTNSLNGLYLAGPHEATSHGVNWSPWKGHRYSLKRAEMKLRPLSALARLEGL